MLSLIPLLVDDVLPLPFLFSFFSASEQIMLNDSVQKKLSSILRVGRKKAPDCCFYVGDVFVRGLRIFEWIHDQSEASVWFT